MDLRAKSQVVAFVLVIFVIAASRTAPVHPDHAGCAHTLRFTHVEGNKTSASSSVKSVVLSTLAKIQLQNRMRNVSYTSVAGSKLEGQDLVVIQKLLNDMNRRDRARNREEADSQEQAKGAPVRCGKRCRRRRRHDRRRKGHRGPFSEPLVFRPPRTDPGILKSSKPALVITKDTQIFRKDWCKTERLEQQIREPGCKPKTVVNNFCYGQCNSFFIPNGEASDDSGRRVTNSTVPDFKSCAVCKPRLTSWIKVTLRCPGMIPPTRTKRVLRVHKCRCQTETSR